MKMQLFISPQPYKGEAKSGVYIPPALLPWAKKLFNAALWRNGIRSIESNRQCQEAMIEASLHLFFKHICDNN